VRLEDGEAVKPPPGAEEAAQPGNRALVNTRLPSHPRQQRLNVVVEAPRCEPIGPGAFEQDELPAILANGPTRREAEGNPIDRDSEALRPDPRRFALLLGLDVAD
jgi:hypothetical protein